MTITEVGEVVGNMKKNALPSEGDIAKAFAAADLSQLTDDDIKASIGDNETDETR